MANVAGGGGGIKPAYPIFPGGFTNWEEEWKKKLKIRPAETAPTPTKGGLVSTDHSRGAPSTTTRSQRQEFFSPVQKASPIEQLPHQFFADKVKEASRVLSQDAGRPKSVVFDYQRMARVYKGTEGANDRIKRIATLWKTYMPGLDGSSAIFTLAKSPYTTSVIEGMLAQGYKSVYGRGAGKESVVPADLVTAWGGDPNNELDVNRTALSIRMFGGPQGNLMNNNGPRDRMGNLFGRMPWVAAGMKTMEELRENAPAEQLLTSGDRLFNDLAPDGERVATIVAAAKGKRVEDLNIYGELSPQVQGLVRALWYDPAEESGTLAASGGPTKMYIRDFDWFKNATDQEKRALERANEVWRARWRDNHPDEWKHSVEQTFNEALAATAGMAMIGGPLSYSKFAIPMFFGKTSTQIGLRSMYFLGFVGGITPYALAQEKAEERELQETAAAQYLQDPLGVTSRVEDVRLGSGQFAITVPAKVTMADEAEILRSYIYTINTIGDAASVDVIKEIERNLQYGVYAPTGRSNEDGTPEYTMITPGFGVGNPIDGVWGPEDDQALYDYFEWQGTANIADMMMLQELNYLDHAHPLDGNMNDPAVIEAIALMQTTKAQYAVDSSKPDWFRQTMHAADIPLSKAQLRVYANELQSEGRLQGLFRIPIKVAEHVGKLFEEGVLGAINYGVRAQADPLLQKFQTEAIDYAAEKGTSPLLLKKAPWMLKTIYEDDLKDDPEAQRIWGRLTQQVGKDVQQYWHADIRGTLATALGMDPAKVDEMTLNDPVGMHMYNLLAVGAATVAGAKLNIFTSGKGVPPNAETLLADPRFFRDMSRVVKEISVDNVGGAQSLIKGRDAAALVSELETTYRGWLAESPKGALKRLQDHALQRAAEAYAEGRSIFPHYRVKGMSDPSYTKVMLERKLGEIQDPVMHTMFKGVWKLFERAPIDKVRHADQKSANTVYSNALAASRGDYVYAQNIRNQWVRARKWADYEPIADSLVNQANAHFRMEMSGGTGDRAYNVNPLTGKEQWGGTIHATTTQEYAANIHGLRQVRHAAYATEKQTNAAFKTIDTILNGGRLFQRNISRYLTTPARRITVGYSPRLAVKHLIVDPGRAMLEGGIKVVAVYRRYARDFEGIMGELDPRTAGEVQLSDHIYKASEAQWAASKEVTPQVDYVPARIYEINPKSGRLEPLNMKRGISDLRRWATDDVFIIYSREGVEGLRNWLKNTPEGREWLETSKNLKYTEDNLNQAAELEGEELFDLAVEDFIGRVVPGEFEAFGAAAPKIYEGLQKIAKGELPLLDKNLRAIVEEANTNGVIENPYLRIDLEPPKTILSRFGPGNTVKYLMWANKQARQLFYRATFVDTYKGLVKAGIDKDRAALAAVDVAEMKTTRAMFDLADMTYAESQLRWFAFFATKHRLYATWMGKMAIERPWVAGAAHEIMQLMEARNEQKGVEDWQKYQWVIDTPWLPWSKRTVINIPPMFWLADYPIESTPGKATEWLGAQVFNMIPGAPDVRINWGSFGPSLIRFDRLLLTTAQAMQPLLKAAQGDLTDEWVRDWIDGMNEAKLGGPAAQKQWSKAIGLQIVWALKHGEGEISAAEATKRAALAAIKNEFLAAGKPVSAMFYSEDRLDLQEFQRNYFNATPDQRHEMLMDPENEWFAYSLGLGTTNPAKRANVEEGWRKFNDNRDAWRAALYRALEDGTIMDNDIFNETMDYYEGIQTSLFDPSYRDEPNGVDNYNADFAEAFQKGGFSEFLREDALSIIAPLMDPQALAKAGDIPDEAAGASYKKQLKENFENFCKDAGMIPSDLNDPAVFWYKQIMVEEPYQKFMKIDPSMLLTYRQQTAADVLAQGETGPTAKAQYITMVQNQVATKMLGRGIQWNAKSGVNASEPVFALMTNEDKQMIGWNSTPAVQNLWKEWAFRKQATDAYLRDQGVTGSQSKEAISARAALSAFGDELATRNADFKKEWEFSQLPLEERLIELGVTNGEGRAAQGWAQFLGLVQDYRRALSEADNPSRKEPGVGPTARAAKDVAQRYLQKLADSGLKDNEEWWVQFDQLFPLTSFGFNPDFRLENGADSAYWWAVKSTDIPTQEELTGVVE